MPSQSCSGFSGSKPGLRRQPADPAPGWPGTGEQLDVLQFGHGQHRADHGGAIAAAARRRVRDVADAAGQDVDRAGDTAPLAHPPRWPTGHRCRSRCGPPRCPGPTRTSGAAHSRPRRGTRQAAGRPSAAARRVRPASAAWRRRRSTARLGAGARAQTAATAGGPCRDDTPCMS